MAHGSGGKATTELISSIFARYFDNPVLAKMEDAAVVPGAARLAIRSYKGLSWQGCLLILEKNH